MSRSYGPPGRLRYLWPLRVAILSAAAIVGLPWLASWPRIHPYLSGVFDPLTDQALLLITPLALFNVWTVMIIARLILTYGSARLDLPALPRAFFPIEPWAWGASALAAVPVLWQTLAYSSRASGYSRVAGMLAYVGVGTLIGVALLGIALRISDRLEDKTSLLRRQVARSPFERAYEFFLGLLGRWPALGAGFVAFNPTTGKPELAQGHGLAFGLAFTSLLLYVGAGFLTRDVQRPELASTLAYVLLLLLVLTWAAGLAAFLLDRGRLPLSVLLLVWILLVNTVIHPIFPTDHIYRTVDEADEGPVRTPPERLLADGGPSIVVAASGGGIQAAAWTARVLTGLGGVEGFGAGLRLVSAVSGGSVGTMNVLAGRPTCGPPQTAADRAQGHFDPDAASRESSLHALGWGLVFKDLPRTIAPFFSNPYVDRGSLLEDAWKREPRLKKSYPDASPMLASWRRNVAEGECPGVIYNAMAAETGEPMLFSTVGLPRTLSAYDFYARYPGRDLPMVTAVRLSSGFPYVSPAARADADDEKGSYTHVVDGGYFDNYGVSALAAVVHAALGASRPASGPARLLIVEICDSGVCSGQEAPATPAIGGDDRGWPYQLVAPLSAVIAMRSAAQRASNRTVLRLLKDYWNTRERGACIESIQVPFGDLPAPLSWHLTEMEKNAIDDAWSRIAAEKARAVADFLAGRGATPEGQACLAAHAAN